MYSYKPEQIHETLLFANLFDFMMREGFGKKDNDPWTDASLVEAIGDLLRDVDDFGERFQVQDIMSRATYNNYRVGRSRPPRKEIVLLIIGVLTRNEDFHDRWSNCLLNSWDRSRLLDAHEYRHRVHLERRAKKAIKNRYSRADMDQKLRPKPKVLLGPNKSVVEMLKNFPSELEDSWFDRSIDGAVEIARFSWSGIPYAGIPTSEISCTCRDHVWWPPDGSGHHQCAFDELALAMLGARDGSFEGWIAARGTGEDQRPNPNPIRFLIRPFVGPSLDRRTLHLEWGCSDYFTSTSVAQLSKLGREGKTKRVNEVFTSLFWGTPETGFPENCVPYHVSVQAIVHLVPDNANEFILLAATNSQSSTSVKGWEATMAEQCQAPNRPTSKTPWWGRYFDSDAPIGKAETRDGDRDINEAIYRGLHEELGIEHSDIKELRLLNAAIEAGMYFTTFIYMARVELSPLEIYDRFQNKVGESAEHSLLAAYRIKGKDCNGVDVRGANRMAELLSHEKFDGRPHILPKSYGSRPLLFDWHPSSRLRLYAAGRHLFGNELTELVSIEV